MITITIVRHGQSVDNTKKLWAGWSDSPLSNDGMKQANALGKSLKDTKFDAIVCSDLKRANWTADQIHQYQPEPKPPLTVDRQLREQHFGVAEGKSWGGALGKFEPIHTRTEKYEGAESSEDVRKRANDVIAQYIEPLLKECHGKPASSKHIAVVAHGIFNSEFVGALLARLHGARQIGWRYRGMANTGWTRLQVGYAVRVIYTASVGQNRSEADQQDEKLESSEPVVETNPTEDHGESYDPAAGGSAPLPPVSTDSSLPPLAVRIIANDVTTHFDGLVLKGGSLGAMGYDPNQQDLRAFFGGSGASKV